MVGKRYMLWWSRKGYEAGGVGVMVGRAVLKSRGCKKPMEDACPMVVAALLTRWAVRGKTWGLR